MNYQDKISELKRIKGLFLNNYPEGCLKISPQESIEHIRVKCEIMYYLKKNDFRVYSEPNLKGLKGRLDILCFNNQGHSYIIEVINHESKESIKEKEIKYPLPLIKVNVKGFKFEDFKL